MFRPPRSPFAFLLIPLALAACDAAAIDDDPLDVDVDTSDKADGALWRKVLDCDGGAAVLDVLDSERRQLQFVIRDPNIADYLADATQLPRDKLINSSGEIILSAFVDRGVFGPGDFSTMSPPMKVAYDDRLHVFPRVFRDFTGVKAELRVEQADEFRGECDGGTTECVPVHWRQTGNFNWYFGQCL